MSCVCACAGVCVQEFCNEMKYGLTPEQVDELMIRKQSLTGELEVDCFMDDRHNFLKVAAESVLKWAQIWTRAYVHYTEREYLMLNDNLSH